MIGRISPEEKRRVVETLRDEGRYVAMIGDGVNDVPALKAARLAIAQGTGTQMAKSVADVVLVRGDFAAVPAMVEEGRKILRNLQRVTKLFVTKSVFASVLIVSVGLTPTAYPLLPRHLTLAATLTIGVPAFFLALAPSSGGYRIKGFLREVASFSVPAGTAAGLGVLSSYLFALNVLDLPLIEARTVATTVLVDGRPVSDRRARGRGSPQERRHRRALRGSRRLLCPRALDPVRPRVLRSGSARPRDLRDRARRRRFCRRRSRDHVRGVPSGPSVVPRTLLRRFRRCQVTVAGMTLPGDERRAMTATLETIDRRRAAPADLETFAQLVQAAVSDGRRRPGRMQRRARRGRRARDRARGTPATGEAGRAPHPRFPRRRDRLLIEDK